MGRGESNRLTRHTPEKISETFSFFEFLFQRNIGQDNQLEMASWNDKD